MFQSRPSLPAAGIAPENKDRVLISIHGGGFTGGGGGIGGAIEAIPIAGVGRIKVVAVDYRLMPEHTMQDAVDDILTFIETC
jgi:acetyl esterase/lipase